LTVFLYIYSLLVEECENLVPGIAAQNA